MHSMPQDSGTVVSPKKLFLIGGIFYLLFLLLTPLGLFNDWIPPLTHSGYYSVKTVDAGDDTAYYSYLRSLFFDGDLDFIDERYYAHINRFNSTGYVWSNWQLGQAVLYLPFFIVGHFFALLYSALGYPIKADGYSSPYFVATAVASATYLFAGLMIMCRVLKKIVGERIAVIASVSLWMASPLLYYTFIRQRMAHTTEFFLAALFVMAWLHYRGSNKKHSSCCYGGLSRIAMPCSPDKCKLRGSLYRRCRFLVVCRKRLCKLFQGNRYFAEYPLFPCHVFGFFIAPICSVESIEWLHYAPLSCGDITK